MIIDSHCHIDFEDFDTDRDEVLQRAQIADISKIIVPGVTRMTWQRVKSTCQQYPQLYPCYGLHPYFIDQHNENDLLALKHQLLDDDKTVAIGECGLDFFLNHLDRKKQHAYFEQQLDLAIEFNLPVVVHARKSTEAVITAIKKRPGLRGMIHSYSGSYEQAIQLISLGFYLSFGGPITYDKATRLHKLVKSLPLSSLLIETDAPDQAVAKSKSQRNEPACIIDVATHIAQLHNIELNELTSATTRNAEMLFAL
ncbi:MAG TPA: TatD family deoxyribonuclease [Gammaproteobacteria bacterium]|nr:TatD family deoxyribonuclease [Gammaproteobacteria bacterium]